MNSVSCRYAGNFGEFAEAASPIELVSRKDKGDMLFWMNKYPRVELVISKVFGDIFERSCRCRT